MNKYIRQVFADTAAMIKFTRKYDKKHHVTSYVVCSVCGYGGGTLKKTDDGYICMSCLKNKKEMNNYL